MANNQNNKSVDRMIEELDDIFTKNYLWCKKKYTLREKIIMKIKKYQKIDEPYKKMLTEIKKYKNQRERKELFYAVKNKMALIEVHVNLENALERDTFVVFGILITITGSLIVNNYSDILDFNNPSTVDIIGLIVYGFMIILVMHLWNWGKIRRANNKKCFYQLVYDILNDID